MIAINDMDITAVVIHYRYCDSNDLSTAFDFEVFDTLGEAKAFRQRLAREKRYKKGAVWKTRLLNFGDDDREIGLIAKALVKAAARMEEIKTVSRIRSCGMSKEEEAVGN
jgi:hypothetical protein